MLWYIAYKGKAKKDTLKENLKKAGIEYYLPHWVKEYMEDNQMKVRKEEVMRNLIFVKTDQDIMTVIRAVDGLRYPYTDRTTGQPATIPEQEMQRFMNFMEFKNINATVLQDPFQRFKVCQKVRVKAGDFEGTEGYVFRIRGDRKLVISLGEVAIAISGIHHTLLEPID